LLLFVRGKKSLGFSLKKKQADELIDAIIDNFPETPLDDHVCRSPGIDAIGQAVPARFITKSISTQGRYYADKKPGEYTGD
jgi:hypothetical protein